MIFEFNCDHEGTRRILAGAPRDFQEIADSLSEQELAEVEREITGIAQWLCRAAGYLNARDLGHDHNKAVKAANSTVAAFRKAIGFTQHRNDLSF